MGHHDDGQPRVVSFLQEVEDLASGRGVEVPRRFVGEQDAGVAGEGPGDGGSLVAVRLGNGMVEYAVAFFSEAAHESFAGAFEPPEAFFNKFAAQQFAHGHEFWPEYLPPGFETKG